MFIQRVKHYHQWLRTSIHFKTKYGPSDSVRIQGPSKRPSSGHLYPVSSVKEHNRKCGKCKISRVLQSPVSIPQASPKVEAGHRLKQAQHFSTRRKVQNRNSRVHQDLPDSREMCALLWKIMTSCHHYHITLKAKKHCHSRSRHEIESRSASDQSNEESDEPRIPSTKPKKYSDKSKHKSRSRYVSSSSEEDQSSVARHRSSKLSGAQPSGAASDQDLPQHDPDPLIIGK